MNNKDNINHLLLNVANIVSKYNEIARVSGENFNIFSIMNMEYSEVKTHSAIITELLNPKGTHGKGSVFLNLFLEELAKENIEISSLDLDNVTVLKEEYIGRINEDYTKGGNIDIVIKDNKYQIVIENKIDAGDQYNQLLRYKNHYLKSTLLYLTLYGIRPSKDSIKHLEINKDFYCVSYEKLIKNWLERIIDEVDLPNLIKENIRQYYICVCNITNQNTSVKMNNEIKQLFNENNIESIQELSNNFKNLVNESKESFYFNLSKKIEPISEKSINEYFKLNVIFKEDSDSFYIGIILTENNINKNNIDFKYLIKEKLKEFKNNIFIDTNENFFIWYAPNIENRKFIFEHLDIKIIYKIYSDDNYLNEITNNISNELNEILEFIKEEILKHLKT
jgi:hypothetical protein